MSDAISANGDGALHPSDDDASDRTALKSREEGEQPKYQLETGWYLPGNPDPWSERTPADLAEEQKLLSSEDFFAIVGLALKQIDRPEGSDN
jgi:hypothetical protein